MAFFKFRARGQKGDEQSLSPAETIDDMRRRARHRLIGAAVLVLIGVLGFPLLFDSQPRPLQVDIPIEIPDRDKTRPLGAGGKIGAAEPAAAPAEPPTPAVIAAAPVAPAPAKVAPNASLGAKEEVMTEKAARPAPHREEKEAPPARPVAEAKIEHKPESKPEPKVEAKAEPKVERKAEVKAPAATDDGVKARALLEGKPPAVDGQERFILQVGAFADAEKARETRVRLERAGLKTYTQVVETKDGKRIRVRVGPYAQRADAEKAASQIKSLSLPVSVLAL